MKGIIVASGPQFDESAFKAELAAEAHLLICADGGMRHLRQAGVLPALWVGDFDSFDGFSEQEAEAIERVPLPAEKNWTDTAAAAKIGMERGCTHFSIYGASGARMDHSLANLQLLLFLHHEGCPATLIDEFCRIEVVQGRRRLVGEVGQTISLLALGEGARGVTLRGMRYPLHEADLSADFALGISNELAEPCAEIEINCGCLLLFWVKKG